MDEEKIKELIQQAIDQNATANQFAVSDTPFHTHNGSDSQSLKFTKMFDVPSSYYQHGGDVVKVNSSETALEFGAVTIPLVYGGVIAANGTATVISTGWTSSTFGAGEYTITHNLGTTNYSVVVSPLTDSGVGYSMAIYAYDATTVTVFAYDSTNTLHDHAFTFILTVIT